MKNLNMENASQVKTALYPAREVARYLLYLGSNDIGDDAGHHAVGITHLKLQKLLFFAQAYYLATQSTPLFEDEIAAWKYGPVVLSIWEKYQAYEGRPVEYDGTEPPDTISLTDQEIIKTKVWNFFSEYSAGALVEITCEHEPWAKAKNLEDKTITKESIEEYYKTLFS